MNTVAAASEAATAEATAGEVFGGYNAAVSAFTSQASTLSSIPQGMMTPQSISEVGILLG